MSDILACPNCDGPLTDSWLERAMDGSLGKRCEACTKAYHNPYGAAAELPLRRRQLVEAGNELAQVTGDLEAATTALEAAQTQIAALKIEVADMQRQRDIETRKYLEAEKARDAALADLSQARSERDEAMAGRDTLKANLHDTEAMYMRLSNTSRAVAVNLEQERDAAIARAEAAEAQGEAMRVEIAQLTESGVAMVDRWDEERKAHARTRHERDALREEVARQKKHNELLDGSLRQERERRKQVQAACEKMHVANKEVQAKLGRAVAALQWADKALNRVVNNSYEETQAFVRERKCVTAILADPTAQAAAGDAPLCWRCDKRAVKEWSYVGGEWMPWCGERDCGPVGSPYGVGVRPLAAVDARRGGGGEGAK